VRYCHAQGFDGKQDAGAPSQFPAGTQQPSVRSCSLPVD